MSLLNESVLILNKYFLAIQVTTARDAVIALTAERAKVVDKEYVTYTWPEWVNKSHELEKERDGILKDYPGVLRSPSIRVIVPQVILAPDCEFNNPTIRTIRYSRRNVYQRDKYVCQYCGKKCKKTELTLDHVVPKSQGGKSEWTNVVTCCLYCNSKKEDKSLRELGWKLIGKPKRPKWKSHVGVPFDRIKKEYWDMFLN